MSKNYTVFVGGVEVTDFLLTKSEAEELAQAWIECGYDDVVVDTYE